MLGKRVSLLGDYDAQHRHPINRALHTVGIPLVLLSMAALASPWRPFGVSRKNAVAVLAGGWGLLFLGHAIEGNRPAILQNPAAALSGALWWVRRFGARGTAAFRAGANLISGRE